VSAPVVIANYDPRWPLEYDEEKTRLQKALGPAMLAIEHMGSTAVPGLAAKPIIDIMVGVRSLDDVGPLMGPLRELGYEYAPDFEASIPNRRFFRKGPEHARTHHLHVVELDGEFWERHLLFRDYLRRHPRVAHDYEQLKRALAIEYGSDRSGYTEAKTGFIRGIETRARRELTSR
jgi:GrpB-like predicted nucleotidyltransferase (UPF0157 family)